MAINTTININAGVTDKEQQTGKFGAVSISGRKQAEKKEDSRSMMLNGQFDPIEQKKELAKKQAYKIVRDALARELKMDGNMDEVRAHSGELEKDLAQAQDKIGEIDAEKEKWREECGVEADSEERKDLELLEKREAYEDIVNKAQAGIISDNAVIRGTRLERLKKDYIRKARNQAEDVLEAASKEVIGMLVGEAKDHMDKKSEELQEKAEERKEEKEDRQEKIDAAKERKEEMEALTDSEKTSSERTAATQAAPPTGDEMTEAMAQLDGQRSDYQREIEEMMRKMKLVTEDIKGVRVDEIL